MRLLYLYIKKFGILQDQEFNFDSNIRFKYDKEMNRLKLIDSEQSLPQNFFSGNCAKYPVDSISALIGDNGAGKTSVAAFLQQLFLSTNNMQEHIIVLDLGENKLFCQYHLLKNITSDILRQYKDTLSPVNLKIFKKYLIDGGDELTTNSPEYWQAKSIFSLSENLVSSIQDTLTSDGLDCRQWQYPTLKPALLRGLFNVVYYSPFYTTESVITGDGDEFCDLSTTGLLGKVATGNDLPLHEIQGTDAEYYQNDLRRSGISQIMGHKFREIKRILKFLYASAEEMPINFPKPHGMLLSPNKGLLEIAKSDFIARRDQESDAQKKDIYTRIVTILIHINTKDFLIVSFLCHAANYFRDMHGSPSVGFFSDPYVLPLIKFCESIEEKLDKTAVSQSIHKDILNFLKERKPQVYSCFHLLEELCMAHQTRTLSLVQNPENVYCECFRDKWWQWTLNFIDAYQKSLVITEYLSYSFEPKLSSGEMAFLTLWGRLYDYLINRNNEHILLFLDEIEITLHPEWQRRLVSDMIEFLNKFARENHIHLLFSSHSPILLSDIPIENVCFLQRRGNCSTVVTPKIHNTFGANIYDLYREPFFLANGVVGEFSSRKIDCWVQCLRQITCDNGKAQSINDELQKINSNIQIIGDDLFRKQIEKVIKAIMTMREFQSSGREVNNDKN